MRKTTKLKKIINSRKTEFIMEAHNGLSAKIVEEAGFDGIWASGLTLSAALGVRDSNEASWTQILEVLEFMSDRTSIPILLDGDTGYGNFNNARRLVRKLEQRQVAGVCIEDKLFPKTNSFLGEGAQVLADVDEFCGKIKAVKDAQQDPDFVVVARVEAFIAGWGVDEAIRRAEAYRKAGADAVLIHSKKSDVSDIEAFMKQWGNRHPVVIVPTKYYSVPTEKFRDLGVSLVIWANHTLRSSITAMQKTTGQIFRDQSLVNVEEKISSVAEIFRLQDNLELEKAEKKYLPSAGKNVNAIILAASQGKELGKLTKKIPKTLLKVGGKTVLAHQIDALNQIGVKDITVVRGFAKGKIVSTNIKTIDNDNFASTTELDSLFLAEKKLGENTFVMYGDIVFRNYILSDLLNDTNDITIVADADWEEDDWDYREYIKTDVTYSKKNFFQPVKFKKMSPTIKKEERSGEFIGIFKVNKRGAEIVRETLKKILESKSDKKPRMTDLFTEIIKTHPVAVKFIKGSWLDINTIVDLQKAGEF